ncbi:MAG: 4Fe-4S binding protein [Beduini sp.]|uniref:4Fe-4S binding protein n=1 Tax=Beduini sp. TaxID=1922300 RepID=UPI0011C8F163
MTIGNAALVKGLEITEICKACGICLEKCPQQCIETGTPYQIVQKHCLHCGLCQEVCPTKTIQNR